MASTLPTSTRMVVSAAGCFGVGLAAAGVLAGEVVGGGGVGAVG